jgi:hypothetical protein
MNLSELISHQQAWEAERGINNPNCNIPRIQVELDEAKAETDPLKILEELIDVQIILAGGLAKAAEEAGCQIGDINEMILTKLAINSAKYQEEIFAANPTSTAIIFARHYWKVDPDEWEVDGDVY